MCHTSNMNAIESRYPELRCNTDKFGSKLVCLDVYSALSLLSEYTFHCLMQLETSYAPPG